MCGDQKTHNRLSLLRRMALGIRSTNNLRQDESDKLWSGKQIFAPGAPTHQPSQMCTDVIGA